MNKKKFGALLVGISLMIAGCGGGGASDTIKIGANLEMTGGSASFGASATNGKKVELVIVDNKSEAAESASAMQKLVQDKVVAVIAPIASSSVIAGAQINQDSKVLAISPTASNPKVTVDEKGKVRPYLFRASFIDPFQGSVMAAFATKSLKAKTAAIYIDNSSDYAKGLAKYFEEEFVKAGGQIVIKEAYLQKDTDFKATLTKIKATNPEVIFVPGYYQEVGLIIKQSRDLGMKMPVLGGDGWDSVQLTNIAGAENLENTFFCNHYSAEDKSPKVTSFVEAYQKAYGQVPDSFAALAYDATWMIIKAMERADSTDPVKIRDEMEKTKDHDGVSGKTTLNATHDAVKGAVIIAYQGGKQVFKERVAP